LINPLVAVRDVHLISTLVVAGILFFDIFIASAIWRMEPAFPATQLRFQSFSRTFLWIALTLSITSALAWLVLLSMRIGHKSIDNVITDGTAWLVLSQTQFGLVWQLRLLLGALLAACVLRLGAAPSRLANGLTILTCLCAGAYLGSLAFAGHGAEGLGLDQDIHLVADVLHLVAAGLWLGALVPLVLLLACLWRFQESGWVSAAAQAGSRFSTLGILAVGILLVSGTINAAFLLTGMHSLIDTDYGRLLLLKLVLAGTMVGIAAINRQYLLPRLSDRSKAASGSVQTLIRSALIEIALGLAIVCIVGALGIMPPANEMAAHMH
jgi:copper resistance protein D